MKYIILCLAALAVCILIAWAVSKLLLGKKKHEKTAVVVMTAVISVVMIAGTMLGYLSIYYHADDSTAQYLVADTDVTVSRTVNGYLFDGPGTGKAIIFYPGAKVQPEAYGRLMHEIARNGTDVFLVKMPFNMAVFNSKAADVLMENFTGYDNWYLAGHSLGGVIASGYASEHADKIRGIILLASYPNKQVDETLSLLSIYGSEDGCLDSDAYEEGRVLWPTDSQEMVIAGGNHAQYGDYGFQKGDNKAGITAAQQQDQTADIITEWIGSNQE